MRDGFIKVAAGTPKIRVADCRYNAEQIFTLMREADKQGVKVLCLPELCLTGYTCGDLFLHDTLLKGAEEGLQTILEATRNLELVSTLPESSILIEADGRHLWRVLENVYNNAFKYAMEHTRVYTDLERKDDKVYFTIKNISANPLNVQGEELTERFVRGDVSRTTEGSGLGLSIAQSLTKLQGGTFEILIDGDLFKVRVGFPVKKAEQPA